MDRADTSHGNEALDPRLLECYRHATPSAKLAVVARLNESLIMLKDAALRAAQPELLPEKRRELLRRWWLGASD